MKVKKGFFWQARSYLAVIEGWLIGGLILALIALVMREASTYTTGQGVLLAAVLAAGWTGIRARFSQGDWRRSLLSELWWGSVLALGMLLIETGLVESFGVVEQLKQSNLGPTGVYLALASTAILYWGVRVASLLLQRWIRLVRTRFQWNLVNIILVLVALLGIAFVLTVGLLSRGSAFKPEPIEDVSPLVPLMDMLVRIIFPYVVVALAAAFAAVLVVLPPAFLVAYFVSRGLTRRLAGLVQAARRLRSGDWSARVERIGEDELAQLQDDFNAMAAELEQVNRDLQASRDQVAGLLRSQRELTAAVSHELRTPVATLRGYVESNLSQDQVALPAEYLRDLEIMQREVLRLQKLIDDLFTLSRAEVGQLSLNFASLDASGLVREVVETVKKTAWQSGKVEVTAEAPVTALMVRADGARLEQVVRNLIDNAVRYTPPGGIVVVQARAIEGKVEIVVADTGPGIAEEDLPHIWERFYRASEASDGSGLGLALVRELVDAMGGSVGVESQAGQGSRFSIRLKGEKGSADQ